MHHAARSSTATIPALLALLALGAFTGCASLRDPGPQPVSTYLTPAQSGPLTVPGRQIRAQHGPAVSGFHLLERNNDALLWRLALADHATRSIDAQYFIWQSDETGRLLVDRLLAANDRGVRVRLLVDDLALATDDRIVAAISHRPNFEIKVFNPGYIRGGFLGPILEFLTNFDELNRRMHNKVFVADNQLAIVGGRNIGNEYFGLARHYNFRDLDVLVAGPVVPEISDAFDEYWNAPAAYPGRKMSKNASADDLPEMREDFNVDLNGDRRLLDPSPYPVARHDWRPELNRLAGAMHTGEAHFIQDEPVTHQSEQRRLLDTLDYLTEQNHDELIVSTPYLIPVGDFLDDLARLTREGVKVKVLTAGMDSNNHTVAHSHYKKYRKRVIRTGATLTEYKSQPSEPQRDIADVSPVTGKFISLHTKTLIGDQRRSFIGSLNLDPRAMVINTENGLLIESPGLARDLAARMDTMATPENAWSVTLDENNRLLWESASGTTRIQPARDFGQRIADFFFRLLPIESQL